MKGCLGNLEDHRKSSSCKNENKFIFRVAISNSGYRLDLKEFMRIIKFEQIPLEEENEIEEEDNEESDEIDLFIDGEYYVYNSTTDSLYHQGMNQNLQENFNVEEHDPPRINHPPQRQQINNNFLDEQPNHPPPRINQQLQEYQQRMQQNHQQRIQQNQAHQFQMIQQNHQHQNRSPQQLSQMIQRNQQHQNPHQVQILQNNQQRIQQNQPHQFQLIQNNQHHFRDNQQFHNQQHQQFQMLQDNLQSMQQFNNFQHYPQQQIQISHNRNFNNNPNNQYNTIMMQSDGIHSSMYIRHNNQTYHYHN